MREFIRKAIPGPVGAYVQALVVALILAGVIYATIGASCYEPTVTSTITSRQSRQRSGQRPDFRVYLGADNQYARPGERAERILGGIEDPGTDKVSYHWNPPWGATNLSFNPPPDPGSPPYIWSNRSPNDEIYISYNQSTTSPFGESAWCATDTARVEWDGQSSATSYTVFIRNESAELAPALPPAASPARNRPEDTADLWKVEQWTGLQGITLTTDLCQDWFALMQSDDAFLALREPVSPTTVITEGYPLPIVFGGPYSNTLQLLHYDGLSTNSVITVPLELRPERFTFLENALPSASGEHWMALGLVSETVTCPGYDLAAGDWEFYAQVLLDLTHQPNNCEGCVLPFYYCYEGQNAPLAFAALAVDATSYQGWGITCIGPYAAPLAHHSAWNMGGASSAWVTPTQSITFSHYIHLSITSDPITFTLDYTAPLGVAWRAFGDDLFGPDLDDPIIAPFPVTPGQYHRFWLISDPVPADTPAGSYSLMVTATSVLSPADSLWASDGIWVGQWVAPPAAGHDFWVYLPLVMRSH